jgi:hypothetical protein
MIDVEEHKYDDDPSQGPPDVKTLLEDVSYFFLGNGGVQAAVQVAPGGEGTPVGLLVMDPERLRKKREALTFDPETGLEDTLVRVSILETGHTARGQQVEAGWSNSEGVPKARVEWRAGSVEVCEEFFCPDPDAPVLARILNLRNPLERPVSVCIETGVRGERQSRNMTIPPLGSEAVAVVYTLDIGQDRVAFRFEDPPSVKPDTRAYWAGVAQASFGSRLLDRWFEASRFQLGAAVSACGRVDASIWQYNREWVRDHSWIAVGLLLSGQPRRARVLLERLLREFVTPQGDTIDSSERRHPDEVELDQNGELLYALDRYTCWTGDLSLLNNHWTVVEALAEFPLQDLFRHATSGLLNNVREYWERHRAHGIRRGMELAHQMFVILGLNSAAGLARLGGHKKEASRWKQESDRLFAAAFEDPKYGFIDQGRLVKRRRVQGEVAQKIQPLPEAQLPSGTPLASAGDHFLNPDTSTALPVAFEVISAESPLAVNTLASLDELWNQAWEGGGYGRYHCSSEPDAGGSWPFPSLFVARACLEAGDYARTWRILRWLDTVPGARSGTWFEFYGQPHSPPFAQIGIAPWNWSEMLLLLVHHIAGIRPGFDRLRLRPRLLPGMQRVELSLPLRGHRLNVLIRGSEGDRSVFSSDAPVLREGLEDIEIEYREADISVEAEVCYHT